MATKQTNSGATIGYEAELWLMADALALPRWNGLCFTDIVVVGARQPKWSALVLAGVSSSASVAHTSQTATGTKMPQTSWQAMSRYELCRPTDTIASEFQRIVSPMSRRIVGNIHESRTLAALRDALLPKVISGETRVPDAEKRVGASP